MKRRDDGTTHVVEAFRSVLGRRHVLTGHHRTKTYRTGYRGSAGKCLAVLRPGTLLEMWHTLEIAVQYDLSMIMQAANTGLTGGSTPHTGYEHDVVIISTSRLTGIHLVDGGRQAICLPGSTLHKLEQILKPLGREPHSVIGSSCLGASVIGGICNNSGGSLVERGPAYTEHAVFARLTEEGDLILENRLGVDLGSTPGEILHRLESGNFREANFEDGENMASDHEYREWVRDIHAPTPARYNADPRRLKDASGCAGKLAVFGVRVDTFPKNTSGKTFFIGTRDAHVLTELRRTILSEFSNLPVSAEYMDRCAFVFTGRYGRDTVYLIRILGTRRLPAFFRFKETLASRLEELPMFSGAFIDHCLQVVGRLMPDPLSRNLRRIADSHEHLLILKVKTNSIEETSNVLSRLKSRGELQYRVCPDGEARTIGLHRFAAAGAAVRYQTIHASRVGDLLALDIALPRNTTEWREELPPDLEELIEHKLYYGHFMCQIFHQDYILKTGTDSHAIKTAMLNRLEERGARYPAEHNVGHLYRAEPPLCAHYRSLDPGNRFNPGIGKDSKRREYAD
ncbi:MAG: D-lactate dehydrogenase [Hyphomonadaceae bacterium]|nr:D-lactate dehydrogenase [Hyphomonadaceae bacterium]